MPCPTPWFRQIFSVLVFVLLATTAQAIPPTISIQGSLVGSDGKALTGVRVWRVQFYDAQTGGNALGGAFNGVGLVEAAGRFSIELPPPAEVLAATGTVWYELAIDSAASPDAAIDPADVFPKRVAVQSVLFAQRAAQALAANTATTATVALNSQQSAAAHQADTATTASVALSAQTLNGIPAGSLVTPAELTNGLAAKADLAHSHNLDSLSGSVTDTQVPDSITINHAATATTATFAATAGTATSATIAYQLQGEAFLMVRTTGNPAANAANLLATYAAAKTRTPHGQPLSASNRVVIIVSPGQYDLGTGALTLDADFVDIEGLLKDRDNQHIYSASNGPNTGVLMQTANDVRIENLWVECTRSEGGLNSDPSGPAAYFPSGPSYATVIRNCRFLATYDNSNAFSMRIATEYGGTYEDCVGGYAAFGGYTAGIASGTFTNCIGAAYAFGGYGGKASGFFTHCTGNIYSFGTSSGGSSGTASGVFTDCTGGYAAFGAVGVASGTFQNCMGGSYSFGYNGEVSGVFVNCNVNNAYIYQGGGTVTVCATTNVLANAFHLREAYAYAILLKPNGAPLSALNRALVVIPPGSYNLDTFGLTLNTDFVDIEGLSKDREKQHLYGSGTGVLIQTADNVRIENLWVECTLASGGLSGKASDPAAYFPDSETTHTVVSNCRFLADDLHARSMRVHIAYPGTYENCQGGELAFGGRYGEASGTFINCVGGNYAFGGSFGTASGTFLNCTGAGDSFGGTYGTASGTFTNCKGGTYAFGGWYGIVSGTFTNCTGDSYSFGNTGTVSGIFTQCSSGLLGFGAGGTAPGARFYYCNGGNGSFTTTGSPAPKYRYCLLNGEVYP
jgi:hypothetical protein